MDKIKKIRKNVAFKPIVILMLVLFSLLLGNNKVFAKTSVQKAKVGRIKKGSLFKAGDLKYRV